MSCTCQLRQVQCSEVELNHCTMSFKRQNNRKGIGKSRGNRKARMLSGRITQATQNKKDRTRDYTDSQPSQATNESV